MNVYDAMGPVWRKELHSQVDQMLRELESPAVSSVGVIGPDKELSLVISISGMDSKLAELVLHHVKDAGEDAHYKPGPFRRGHEEG